MKKLAVLFFLFILTGIPNFISGKDVCQSPFTEGDVQNLCQQLVEDVKSSILPEQVVDRAMKFVLDKVNIGNKGTFGQDSCYEVSRTQIQLLYETHEMVIIDKFIDLGEKKDQEVIIVKSCQLGDKSDLKDHYASVSVQIFLKESKDVSLALSADKINLEPGESTKVRAELTCGDCELKNETISFAASGPGKITPETANTGDDGIARSLFKSEEEGKTEITANYKDNTDTITITTWSSLWDIEITIDYTRDICGYIGPDWSNLRLVRQTSWRYTVSFQNIPLNKMISSPVMASMWFLHKYRSEGKITGINKQLRSVPGKYNENYYAISRIQGSPICNLGFAMAQDSTGIIKDALGFGYNLSSAFMVYNDGKKEDLQLNTGDSADKRRIPFAKIKDGTPFAIVFDADWGDDCKKDWGAPKWHTEVRFTPKHN